MPGWPTVGRADDQELVDALRRADTGAPAKLYDSYAERLHDYACSLIGEPEAAADAVHDALVTAQGCVDRLKEAARLRSWLYALTRFQVRARMAHRGSTPADGSALPVLDDPQDPELTELVHETLAELSRGEREILELSLRHGLTPAEVAAVLGLTSRQAAGRLDRARDHVENSAAAVVLARTGRAHCPDLSAMVDSWEGPLTPLLRRRLSGHIGGCEVCTERRRSQVSAARLLDLVPVSYPPISLRRRVIDTCVNPERDQTRTLITDRGDSFDRTGFPVEVERRSRRRRPRRLAPVLLAAAGVLVVTGAVVVVNGGGGPGAAMGLSPSPSSGTATSADASPESAPESEPALDEDEPTPEPSPSDTPSADETPSARPAPRPTRAVPRPATGPTRTHRRAPAAARLAVTCPPRIDGLAKIALRARNGSVSWTAAATHGLDVYPAEGTIRAGGSMTIWVTVVEPNASGSGRVAISASGGSSACALFDSTSFGTLG
ncbi:sigma-70 family RNA polymerase sigma factor, partial [Nonomuraea sp. NN258]|uniref:RNA polymerase sigma factor n=1 Tax=Nonomuraea antri TaxID=2730852 RepID=UPI00156965FF